MLLHFCSPFWQQLLLTKGHSYSFLLLFSCFKISEQFCYSVCLKIKARKLLYKQTKNWKIRKLFHIFSFYHRLSLTEPCEIWTLWNKCIFDGRSKSRIFSLFTWQFDQLLLRIIKPLRLSLAVLKKKYFFSCLSLLFILT